MQTCHYCGEEIEFRYVGGSLRPLHINGGSCSRGSARIGYCAESRFNTVDSYLDPNARCPECRKPVFFYRSPYNGRVFFDDVGWPWPKHGCTDKYKGADQQISPMAKSSYKLHFTGRDGKARDVYFLAKVIVRAEGLLIRLNKTKSTIEVRIALSHSELLKHGILKTDIEEAPSIILTREAVANVEVSFMCARLQCVVVLTGTFIV